MNHDRILAAALDLSLAVNFVLVACWCLRQGRTDLDVARDCLNRLGIGFAVSGGPAGGARRLRITDDFDDDVLILEFAGEGEFVRVDFGNGPEWEETDHALAVD